MSHKSKGTREKADFAAWKARLDAQYAEWDRIALISEDAAQAILNARCPASEGWIGGEQRHGWRIRARQTAPACELGAYI